MHWAPYGSEKHAFWGSVWGAQEGVDANRAEAINLLTRSLQLFQAVGNVAVSQLAVAHYHLGHALSQQLLEGPIDMRRRGSPRVTLAIRHLEKSLSFFTAYEYPFDFIRASLQVSYHTLPPLQSKSHK